MKNRKLMRSNRSRDNIIAGVSTGDQNGFYSCPYCSGWFTQKRDLGNHIEKFCIRKPQWASKNVEETCQSSFRRVAERLPTVKCECGAEILFLPDVGAMSRAIEVHVAEHMQKSKASAGAAAEAERIRTALIAQVFSKASKSENVGSHERGSNQS